MHHFVQSLYPTQHSTTDENIHRTELCQGLRHQVINDPNFISRVVTGDEFWVYIYIPNTKQQSSQWTSPGPTGPKKAQEAGVRQRRCFTISSIFIALCIMNASLQLLQCSDASEGEHAEKIYQLWHIGNRMLCNNIPTPRAFKTSQF